jgi:hypothetical protein
MKQIDEPNLIEWDIRRNLWGGVHLPLIWSVCDDLIMLQPKASLENEVKYKNDDYGF